MASHLATFGESVAEHATMICYPIPNLKFPSEAKLIRLGVEVHPKQEDRAK